MKKLAFALVMLFVLFNSCIAEEFYLHHREIFSIELKTGAALDFHSIDYEHLFTDEKSSNFKTKNQLFPLIHFNASYTLTKKLQSSLAFAFNKSKALFQADNYFFTRDEDFPELKKVITKEHFDFSFDVYSLSAGISYEIFPELINGPLKLNAEIFSAFFSNEFLNYEEIVEPENSVFLIDGKTTRTRILGKGESEDLRKQSFGLSFSLEHYLKVARNMFFTQTLAYSQQLQSLSKNFDWHLNGISFALGLRYSLIKEMASPLEP